MKYDEHLPDQKLLLDVEGELSSRDQKVARDHLAGCWKCRARRQELENAISGFVRVYQREFEAKFDCFDSGCDADSGCNPASQSASALCAGKYQKQSRSGGTSEEGI